MSGPDPVYVGAFTVKDAPQRWCPLTRAPLSAHSAGGAMNRFDDGNFTSAATCVGPQCALWRPIDLPRRRSFLAHDAMATDEPKRPDVVPPTWEWCGFDPGDREPAQWIEPENEAMQRVRGYCGGGGPLVEIIREF